MNFDFLDCLKYGYCGNLEENPIVVLIVLFLIIFAISFMVLSKFFTKTKKGWAPWENKKVIENRGAVVIISLAIALLAVYYMKDSFLLISFKFLLYILVIVIFLVILLAFLKFLKKSVFK